MTSLKKLLPLALLCGMILSVPAAHAEDGLEGLYALGNGIEKVVQFLPLPKSAPPAGVVISATPLTQYAPPVASPATYLPARRLPVNAYQMRRRFWKLF